MLMLLGHNIVYIGRRVKSAGVVTVRVHVVTKGPFVTLTIDDGRFAPNVDELLCNCSLAQV